MKRIHSSPVFRHVNWNPGPRDLAQFGWAMLIGFGVLGGIAWLRAGAIGNGALSLWTAGVLLFIAAWIPRLNRSAYLTVYLLTGALGYVVSHVLLTVLFYGLFTPIGALLRWSGRDNLRLRAPQGTMWQPLPVRPDQHVYRQF